MAESDNFVTINENFDTVKTLLNSIRAQGILNTSDIDKLLSGINNKLEKINTEEDIDLIKVFLSELKQNLDERHNVLVSKFGAIESLFSNLLKNSTELPKSSELKELFDVVATNLSVFSREVVAQKETLTDITLRLDAIRSDDSQKKDIIKNITLLKPDLERLNNGFDSLVISLNDNFKTIVKTISSIDKTEYLDKFSDNLNNIEMSATTLLSAIQVLDKKSDIMDSSLKEVATKSDINTTDKAIAELKLINKSISDNIGEISSHNYIIDNLADKIDASVNIIATLKSTIEDVDNANTQKIVEELNRLAEEVHLITTDTKFEDFKVSLASVLKDLSESTVLIDNSLNTSSDELKKITNLVQELNVDTNFRNIITAVEASENSVKNYVDENLVKVSNFNDAQISKVIDDISLSTNELRSSLTQSQSEIAKLCDTRFSSVFEYITDLKNIVSQIDENDVSANNAMFANITDRLNMFEATLKDSLELQENTTAGASAKLYEQIDSIKNLSGIIDYKIDSSVVEISNMQNEFGTLKNAVNDILALNFVETVKNLRADIYATKQEMNIAFENSSNTLSDNFTNDIYGKYELLISKLDSVEDEFKKTQVVALGEVKESLDKITSSIVDVLSYVSVANTPMDDHIDKKLEELSGCIKETNLNYIENVRDVVDVIRIQVENNLKNIEEDTCIKINSLEKIMDSNTTTLRGEIQTSYEKLLEIQNSYKDLRDLLNLNSINNTNKYEQLISTTNDISTEFDAKLVSLKNSLLDKVTEFKQEFSCHNVDQINEFKFSVENISNKNTNEIFNILDSIKNVLSEFSMSNSTSREEALNSINESFNSIKEIIASYATEQNKLSITSFENLNGNISENFADIKNIINAQSKENNENKTLTVSEINNRFNNLQENLSKYSNKNLEDRQITFDKINNCFNELKSVLQSYSGENYTARATALEKIYDNFNKIQDQLNSISYDMTDGRTNTLEQILNKLGELHETTQTLNSENFEQRENSVNKINNTILELQTKLNVVADENAKARTVSLSKILENFVGLKEYISTLNKNTGDLLIERISGLNEYFDKIKDSIEEVDENIDNDMTRQLSIIESNFESLVSQITILNDKTEQSLTEQICKEYANIAQIIENNIDCKLEAYKTKIEETFDKLGTRAENQTEYLQNKVAEMNASIKNVWTEQSDNNYKQLTAISNELKEILEENVNNTTADYIALKDRLDNFAKNVAEDNKLLAQNLQTHLDDITKYIDSVLDIQTQDTNSKYGEFTSKLNHSTETVTTQINENLEKQKELINNNKSELVTELSNHISGLSTLANNQISIADSTKTDIADLSDRISKLSTLTDDQIDITNSTKAGVEDLSKQFSELSALANTQINIVDSTKADVEGLSKQFSELSALANTQINIADSTKSDVEDLSKQFSELSALANTQINIADSTKTDIEDLRIILNTINDSVSANIESSVSEKITNLATLSTELSTNEIKMIENSTDALSEQIELSKQCVLSTKDFITKFLQQELSRISENIEAETETILVDITDQFEAIKNSQKEETQNIIAEIEKIISSNIISNIEDLKSYLDVKTDNSVMTEKLDNLKISMTSSFEEAVNNINKMLPADVFTSSMSDFKLATEILINNATDKVNNEIEVFIKENSDNLLEALNITKQGVENKLALFDKKFNDTIVEKLEEVKLISNNSSKTFDLIKTDLDEILNNFENTKDEINNRIQSLTQTINDSSTEINSDLKKLYECFDNLRSQISNKSFDEAFQASINKQIGSLENLVQEQLGYLEDINDLCAINLPDVTELNVLLKNTVISSLQNLSEKLENQHIEETLEKELSNVKSEIITQLLNMFNQISFVAEQEEILDFIQEKHDELIDILSHIVTTTDNIQTVQKNITGIDNKIDSIRNEINSINDKITHIISSDGDIDYIYSLQDLETDIANLRLALQDAKENNNSQEIKDLLSSTDGIYKLVESIKDDMPKKQDLNDMAENLVSISTRTNKLILASDESYKTLQDNLQDFKLVINDLDERTKNFAQESGMDRVNAKLNSINSIMQSGAQTNKVFQQVFEYLAEWVDNAGTQINTISNKIESLDDIEQIKKMLSDLKAEAEDDSESTELVEALGTIFEKQAKKINMLEAKLDKIIVETTIMNQNNKIDFTPFEDTLNKFLVVMDDKISSQQNKINSLENKIENIIELIDDKATTQLTKKVGGMDRQIAKLNKSIEKIASHVIEK